MNIAATVWLVLLVVFLIAEAVCAIHLISIWFAVGCLAAMVVAFLGGPIWLQAVLFLAVSCALLAALWPFTKKFLNPKLSPTNIDAVVGTTGVVTEDIDNTGAVGQVKLGAMYWTARSTHGTPLKKGTVVKVDRIEGVKAFVSPTEVSASV